MAVPVPDEGSNNPLKIVVNILISFIGAGVLGLPYSFRRAGILEGVMIMIVVSYFSVKAMLLIIECKYTILSKYKTVDKSPLLSAEFFDGITDEIPHILHQTPRSTLDDNITYSEVGFYAAGTFGQRLVDFTIVISQIGFCCAYLIFITENLSFHLPGVSKETWLIFLLPLLFLLTLYRELHKLASFSFFAQISSLMAFLVVFWFDFENFSQTKKRVHPQEWSIQGFPFFFAVAMYCYEGAGMILALESSLAKPIRHKFKSYFLTVISFVTGLYISFGVCGYLSFGNDTNAIITLNLSRGEGLNLAKIVKLCLCFSLFFTYPVMMFPVTQLLEKTLQRKYSTAKNDHYRNGLRAFLVTLTGIVVMGIPSFANLMALIGSTCCTMLTFIIPGYFHLLLNKNLSPNERSFDYFLILFGILGTIIGTLDTISRISVSNKSVTLPRRDIPGNLIKIIPVNASKMDLISSLAIPTEITNNSIIDLRKNATKF